MIDALTLSAIPPSAEAIRAMMATPKKVLVAKKPEEVRPAAKTVDAAIKHILHRLQLLAFHLLHRARG